MSSIPGRISPRCGNMVTPAGQAAGQAAGPATKHAGGRRPGETRTREAILTAARVCFAERGFDATSLRRIAETAGVDQSLVHHFYGTKENLFLQALELPGKIEEAIAIVDGKSGEQARLALQAMIKAFRATAKTD